jgi:hypothetical protein
MIDNNKSFLFIVTPIDNSKFRFLIMSKKNHKIVKEYFIKDRDSFLVMNKYLLLEVY